MQFKQFIKAVGTGPKGNRDLSFEESEYAMEAIINGKATPEQIGAFLIGWRLKPESNEEYCGALAALDKHTHCETITDSLELGFPFDGKIATPYLFPLVAELLAPLNINLLVMGDERAPSKEGVTTKEICARLPVPRNVHYRDRKEYCQGLHNLTRLRNLLGLRTAINTLEKLPRVGKSKWAITGIFHKPYVPKYIEVFKGRYERFALLQGSDGAPEIFKKGKLWISTGDELQEYFIDPSHFGIEYVKSEEDLTLEEMLNILRDPDEKTMNLARLNAAVYLMVTGKAASLEEGIELLRKAP